MRWAQGLLAVVLAAVLLSPMPLPADAQQCVPPPAGSSRETFLAYADCLDRAKSGRGQGGGSSALWVLWETPNAPTQGRPIMLATFQSEGECRDALYYREKERDDRVRARLSTDQFNFWRQFASIFACLPEHMRP